MAIFTFEALCRHVSPAPASIIEAPTEATHRHAAEFTCPVPPRQAGEAFRRFAQVFILLFVRMAATFAVAGVLQRRIGGEDGFWTLCSCSGAPSWSPPRSSRFSVSSPIVNAPRDAPIAIVTACVTVQHITRLIVRIANGRRLRFQGSRGSEPGRSAVTRGRLISRDRSSLWSRLHYRTGPAGSRPRPLAPSRNA